MNQQEKGGRGQGKRGASGDRQGREQRRKGKGRQTDREQAQRECSVKLLIPETHVQEDGSSL